MTTPVLFDSHAHLDQLPDDELLAVLQRARASGVGRILAIGGAPAANARSVEIARRHPEFVHAAAGYDRIFAGAAPDLAALDVWLADPSVRAVGECGLDYHYGLDSASAQRELFLEMTRLAARHALPLVVHSREADDDTLAMLREAAAAHPDPARLGVLHCFTGGLDFARRLLDAGLFLSFSGIVTFRTAAALREVARFVPADRLLIETDAPYLSPEPLRGRTNEPAHLPHTAECIARERGVSPDRLAEDTTRNALHLFAPRRP
ncbi:MAG: TatD family hydrolase [Kiritimatiellae bacterium]|nr:TatD family hydrolase [Kiritimatiellia bacterium]